MNDFILLVASGIIHPWLRAQSRLRQALRTFAGYTFSEARSLEAVSNYTPYRAAILYFHHKTISPDALERLEAFVYGGGGLLVLHAASSSFKSQPRYFDLLGGRFTGHGPIQTYTVTPTATPDPIFGDITAFTLKDELYWHNYQPDNQVHFTTPTRGQEEPVVWTRQTGAGRICYFAPGHLGSTWQIPQVRTILKRGLAWICEENSNQEFKT